MDYSDDILYLKILICSFLAALSVRHIPAPFRSTVCGLFGMCLVVVVCRWEVLYSLAVIGINASMLTFCFDRHWSHKFSFLFTFLYLALFRCAYVLIGWPKYLPHSNAVQLFVTLRCIGLAFEVTDYANAVPKSQLNGGGKEGEKVTTMGYKLKLFNAYLMYSFSFIGLFTGPYYTFRTFQEMCSNVNLKHVPTIYHLAPKLTSPLLYILIYYLVASVVGTHSMHLDPFYTQHTLLFRFLYMTPVFVILRMRVFVAWTLGEACCIAAGLGACPTACKPQCGLGPTEKIEQWKKYCRQNDDAGDHRNERGWFDELFGYKVGDRRCEKWSFETVNNLDVHLVEMGTSFREGMRGWNRTVQYWLATYVYRRTPSKSMRTAWTMLVSAWWHGVHPGYYLSFLTIPLCLLAEDLVFKLYNPVPTPSRPSEPLNNGPLIGGDSKAGVVSSRSVTSSTASRREEQLSRFERVWWFVKMRGFDYMAMGFLLLNWHSTTRFWASTGWWLQCSMVVLIVGCWGYSKASGAIERFYDRNTNYHHHLANYNQVSEPSIKKKV